MYATANRGFADQSVRPKSALVHVRGNRPPLPNFPKANIIPESIPSTILVTPSNDLPSQPKITNEKILTTIIKENTLPIVKPQQTEHQLQVSKLINDMESKYLSIIMINIA